MYASYESSLLSQRAVESLIGRLVTDGHFREQFFTDPRTTSLRESYDLTARELDAVAQIRSEPIVELSSRLNDRIVRAHIGVEATPVAVPRLRTGERG